MVGGVGYKGLEPRIKYCKPLAKGWTTKSKTRSNIHCDMVEGIGSYNYGIWNNIQCAGVTGEDTKPLYIEQHMLCL